MSNTYRLVNPYIQGEMSTSVKSKNSLSAGRTFYKNLSEHFNNSVPKFYFTIQKGNSGNGKYYHFEVKETKKGDEVKFDIKPYSNGDDSMVNFEGKLNKMKAKFEQAGGKKNSKKRSKKASKRRSFDDDSDLDSSEDFYVMATTYKPVVTPPLYYYWYDPSVYKLESVFIPTFYSYVTPYISIPLF